MIKVNIKPMSVNKAWMGKRYKTKEYKNYEKEVLLLLPKIEIPEGKLQIYFTFGFSSKNADVDNPVKLILDIMQKKYGFNDSRVYGISSEKCIMPKGQEFIDIRVEQYQLF